MLNRYLIIILLNYSWIGNAQDFDCERHYTEFCKSISDSQTIRISGGSYFYSGETYDSTMVGIKDCIYNLDAFCKGVEKALKTEDLTLLIVGQMNHIDACTYYAYEKWGVHLITTGDIISDPSIFDENAGFNFVMKQRIVSELGEKYDQLGLVDTNWVEVEFQDFNEIILALTLEQLSDTSGILRMDKDKYERLKFKYAAGITIIDTLHDGNPEYSMDDLKKGVIVSLEGNPKKFAYLKFGTRNYENVEICRGGFENVFFWKGFKWQIAKY